MATIYKANLTPSKPEMLTAIVARRGWGAPEGTLAPVGSYRFDDPAGEVGIETHIIRAGQRLIQIPLTYRGAPLTTDGAELLATTEHSVLGPRWIYDACTDPVYVQALLTAILTGGVGADFVVHHDDGRRELRPQTVDVTGSGAPGTPVPTIDPTGPLDPPTSTTERTTISVAGLEIQIAHELAVPLAGEGPTLTGTWAGTDTPLVLARIAAR